MQLAILFVVEHHHLLLDAQGETAAEKLLKEYIETYPQGVFGNPAGFYLAEIYFEKELFIEALPFY